MLGFGSRLSVLPQRVNRAKVNHRKLRWSVRASGGSSDGNTVKKAKIYPSRSLLPALFVGASVTNRVIYRILLVPMKNYTFLVSIFVSMCYVLIYGIILNYRFRSGIVSKEMLNFARQKWKSFALIGAMEAITFTIQLYTAARLPGALIGILSQGTLPFTMIFSAIFRQKRYKPVQIAGVVTMIAGVLTTIYPTFSVLPTTLGSSLIFNATLYFLATGFISGALVLKETALQGSNLDVFVVNTFSSAMQSIGTIVLMPISLALAVGTDHAKVFEYVSNGFQQSAGLKGYSFTPWLALSYVGVNLSMNILGLTLVKQFSAVAAILSSFVTVPLITLVFCLKLPLLAPNVFTPLFGVGVFIVLVGLIMYNLETLGGIFTDKGEKP